MFVDLLFGLSFGIVCTIDYVSDSCLTLTLILKLLSERSVLKAFLHTAPNSAYYMLQCVTCNSKHHNHHNKRITCTKLSVAQAFYLSWLCLFDVYHFNKTDWKRCELQAVLSGHFVFWPYTVHWADDAFPGRLVFKACPLFCKKATFSIMKCKNQSVRTRVECSLTPSIFFSWRPVLCTLYSHPLAQPCK